MPDWTVLLEDGFEADDQDLDQERDGELIVPYPWIALWIEDPEAGKLDRPAVKPKDKRPPFNHPEVYYGNRAVSIGTAFASHSAALVLQLIGVRRGDLLRVSAMAMGVSHHEDGAVGGGLGQVVGIGDAAAIESTKYGEWWSTDNATWEERVWHEITVEEIADVDDPWLILRSDAREKWQAQYSHFDEVIVQVRRDDGGPVEPPAGGVLAELDAAIAEMESATERVRHVRTHFAGSAILCIPIGDMGGGHV